MDWAMVFLSMWLAGGGVQLGMSGGRCCGAVPRAWALARRVPASVPSPAAGLPCSTLGAMC